VKTIHCTSKSDFKSACQPLNLVRVSN